MNNMVQISGGNSVQKEIAFKVISKMIDELMPRMKTLDISVKIKKFKGDAEVFCMMADSNRQCEIDVSRDLPLMDFVTVLCHEMMHVKQFARNELPLEKEAYGRESKLSQIVWDANIL